MFTKLKSSLQTKNYLGLSDADLANLIVDPYFWYLREPMHAEISAEKAGTIITLEGVSEFNVDRDGMMLVQPHPKLHEFGLVSFNPFFSGVGSPRFKVRPYKAGKLELDYLYEIRLVR